MLSSLVVKADCIVHVNPFLQPSQRPKHRASQLSSQAQREKHGLQSDIGRPLFSALSLFQWSTARGLVQSARQMMVNPQ